MNDLIFTVLFSLLVGEFIFVIRRLEQQPLRREAGGDNGNCKRRH